MVSKDKNLIRSIAAINIFLVLILCALLSYAAYSWVSKIDISEVVETIQSGERPIGLNRYPIDKFPNQYRTSTQLSESYTMEPEVTMAVLLWHGYRENLQLHQFEDTQLQQRWSQVISYMEQEHPIFREQLPEQRLEELRRIQGASSLDIGIEFLAEVSKVQYDETDLDGSPDWNKALDEWEEIRAQSTYLAVYLIFLDGQANLDPTIYESLDTLISMIGTGSFFADFNRHLDQFFPAQ